jgi:hypothetical protein
MAATIRVLSNEIRPTFEHWLETERGTGARVIILEGLMESGKSSLLERPFGSSTNVDLDTFLRRSVASTVSYVDAIDNVTFEATSRPALDSSQMTLIGGAIAWPIVQQLHLSREICRRVYLKRMMALAPDVWQDERVLNNRTMWPSSNFSSSIYRYHAEQRPWLESDLVVERIEDA